MYNVNTNKLSRERPKGISCTREMYVILDAA